MLENDILLNQPHNSYTSQYLSRGAIQQDVDTGHLLMAFLEEELSNAKLMPALLN